MWCRVIRLPGFDPASSYTIPGALQGHCVKLLKHIGKDHHLRKKYCVVKTISVNHDE